MQEEEHLLWIGRDWRHLLSVRSPTVEMCMLAIDRSPKALHHVKNPTLEMVVLAVGKDPNAIGFVPPALRTESLWLSAVERDGLALRFASARDITAFIDKTVPPLSGDLAQGATPRVVCTAVNQNLEALKWVIPSEDNVEALRELPCMAKFSVFDFVLKSKRQGFTPVHVLERFFNLAGVEPHEIKKVLALMVERKNTRLVIRFLCAQRWTAEQKEKWIRSAMNMVRGHVSFDKSTAGNPHTEFVEMIHALRTLASSGKARATLAEIEASDENPPASNALTRK